MERMTRVRLEARLREAKVNGHRLRLDGINLAGLDLAGLALASISLKHAVLTSVNLSDSVLVSADLTGANLQDAILINANFMAAKLVGADLRNANCENTDFLLANLQNARMDGGTNLAEAHLNCACLIGCRLDGSIMQNASYNKQTIWPAGFDYSAAQVVFNRDVDRRLAKAQRILKSIQWPEFNVDKFIPRTRRDIKAHVRRLEYAEANVNNRNRDWDIVWETELESASGRELYRVFIDWIRTFPSREEKTGAKKGQGYLKRRKTEPESVVWEHYLKHKQVYPTPILCSCIWRPKDEALREFSIEYQSLEYLDSKHKFVQFHERSYKESLRIERSLWMKFSASIFFIPIVLAIALIILYYLLQPFLY